MVSKLSDYTDEEKLAVARYFDLEHMYTNPDQWHWRDIDTMRIMDTMAGHQIVLRMRIYKAVNIVMAPIRRRFGK